MFTKLDDERQAKFINNFLSQNPNCTIKEVIQKCVTNRTRLKYLESQGYITLPKPMSRNKISKLGAEAIKEKFKNYISVSVGREYRKWDRYQ
jgi:hypothetical protein